jgi:hypothetical protein
MVSNDDNRVVRQVASKVFKSYSEAYECIGRYYKYFDNEKNGWKYTGRSPLVDTSGQSIFVDTYVRDDRKAQLCIANPRYDGIPVEITFSFYRE